MNKKVNTVLFLIAATLFNIVVTVGSFLVLIVVYGRLLAPHLPQGAAAWGLPVIFIASIVVAFIVYRYAVKFFLSKIRAEDIFRGISTRRKGND